MADAARSDAADPIGSRRRSFIRAMRAAASESVKESAKGRAADARLDLRAAIDTAVSREVFAGVDDFTHFRSIAFDVACHLALEPNAERTSVWAKILNEILKALPKDETDVSGS